MGIASSLCSEILNRFAQRDNVCVCVCVCVRNERTDHGDLPLAVGSALARSLAFSFLIGIQTASGSSREGGQPRRVCVCVCVCVFSSAPAAPRCLATKKCVCVCAPHKELFHMPISRRNGT